MRILYLHAEVMSYTLATIEVLAKLGIEVHIVHWDHKKLTPYRMPKYSNVYIYKRSEMNKDTICCLARKLEPSITVISGWQDNVYMKVAYYLRTQGKLVVSGFDDQWHHTPRQKIATILAKLGYFSRYYSHAWVSGTYQYEYASRLGFDKKNIIYDLYSADLNLYQKAYASNLEEKKVNYPHRFLFVGRLEPIKGLDILLKAWKSIEGIRKDWELHLIGNGSLRETLQAIQGVVVKDFMQPEKLIEEVAKAGCFVLPSHGEPWGVVVHEFAAAGMPLILSDVVGAASTFLISGLNGYLFKVNNVSSLSARLQQVIETPDEKLRRMSEISHQLSNRISPQTSAANLLSILHRSGEKNLHA